jgi:hypothetical protein
MKRLLLILPIACWTAGCSSMAANSYRNLIGDPIRYATDFERHREIKQYRAMAREILFSSEAALSADFAQGFEDGFAHFMEYGRLGGEPHVPPRRYWRGEYRTPEGRLAIDQWFTGFSEGVHTAATGSFRDFACFQPAELSSEGVIVSEDLQAGSEPIETPPPLRADPPYAAPLEYQRDQEPPPPSDAVLPLSTMSSGVDDASSVESGRSDATFYRELMLRNGVSFVR